MILGRDYVFEAMRFHLKKSVQQFTMPKTISCTPRQFGGSQKVCSVLIHFLIHNYIAIPIIPGYPNVQSV